MSRCAAKFGYMFDKFWFESPPPPTSILSTCAELCPRRRGPLFKTGDGASSPDLCPQKHKRSSGANPLRSNLPTDAAVSSQHGSSGRAQLDSNCDQESYSEHRPIHRHDIDVQTGTDDIDGCNSASRRTGANIALSRANVATNDRESYYQLLTEQLQLPQSRAVPPVADHLLEKVFPASLHFYSEDVTPENMTNVSIEGADVLVVSKTDRAK